MQQEFERAAEYFAHRMALAAEQEDYKEDIIASFKADPETLVMAYQGAAHYEYKQKQGDQIAAAGGIAQTLGILVRSMPLLAMLGVLVGAGGRKQLVHNRSKGIEIEDVIEERVNAYRGLKPRL